MLGGFDLLSLSPLALVPAVFFAGALALFRRAQWASPLLIISGSGIQIVWQLYPAASVALTLVVVFMQAGFASVMWRRLTLGVSIVCALTSIWFVVFESAYSSLLVGASTRDLAYVLVAFLVAALNALAYAGGRLLVLTSTHVGSDFDRAKMLQAQARLSVEVAKQTERLSIARDLTELLVQRISAVVSLSEGGAYAVKSQPESADRVMGKVLESARGAQVELRRLYDMLHEDHILAAAPPRIEDLSELVTSMRSLGYNTKYSVDGEPYEIDEGAELCVFKIVLEGLENIKKHAPQGTDVTVDFFWTKDGLQVLIKDNGIETARRSSAPELSSMGYTQEDDFNALVEKVDGATLSVLNERAAVYEGSVEAQRVPGVGFTLSALFPHLRAVASKK
jgi:signal transduction histidine kinase